MNILVLGGNRYHGRLLVEMLVDKGYQVTVLNRGNLATKGIQGYRHIQADRNDEALMSRLLNKSVFDVVFDNNAYNFRQVEILFNALSNGCGRYVFTSTLAVYLRQTSLTALGEDQVTGVPDPDYPPHVRPYAEGKLTAEHSVMQLYPENHTILRLANVFGGLDFAGKLTYFEKRLEINKRVLLESPINDISLLYVGDAVRILCTMAEHPGAAAKVLNIADSTPMNIHTFFKNIFGAAWSKDRMVTAPAFQIRRYGIMCPVAWGPLLDVSAMISMTKKMDFTPMQNWVSESLAWEHRHFAQRNQSDAFQSALQLEADFMKRHGYA